MFGNCCGAGKSNGHDVVATGKVAYSCCAAAVKREDFASNKRLLRCLGSGDGFFNGDSECNIAAADNDESGVPALEQSCWVVDVAGNRFGSCFGLCFSGSLSISSLDRSKCRRCSRGSLRNNEQCKGMNTIRKTNSDNWKANKTHGQCLVLVLKKQREEGAAMEHGEAARTLVEAEAGAGAEAAFAAVDDGGLNLSSFMDVSSASCTIVSPDPASRMSSTMRQEPGTSTYSRSWLPMAL
jgi:hypothetical protein